jgi:hypothetical protein
MGYHWGYQFSFGILQPVASPAGTLGHRPEPLETKRKPVSVVIRDTLKAALDEAVFDRYIAKLEGTTMNMIEGDVSKAVEVLGNNLGFSETEQSGILRHLAGGGDLSQYGLANAVTRLAEDAADYDRATELETLGARVIDPTRDQWSPIAKAA